MDDPAGIEHYRILSVDGGVRLEQFDGEGKFVRLVHCPQDGEIAGTSYETSDDHLHKVRRSDEPRPGDGGQRGKMVQLLAADPGRVQLERGWSSVMINTILGFLLMIRFCGGPAYQRPHQRVFLHLPIFYPQVSIDHNPSHCIGGHRYLESHIR